MARIAKVKITDHMGIEEFEFTADGRWIEIAGKNGYGKTSVIEAIKGVFAGGKDAKLIRNGSERSETVIVLDDGTTFRRRIGKGAGLTIEKDGVRQKDKPQETIDALHDMLSVNPVAFLAAKPDKRVNVLLETMPMQADPERIREIIGQPSYQVKGAHALDQIKAAYDEVFSQRTGTNRAAKEKESTIAQLSAALPTGDAAVSGSEAEIEAKLAELDQAKEAEDQRIDTKLGGLQRDHEGRVEALQSEIGAIREQIAALQAKVAGTQEAIASEKAAFEVTRGRANQQRQNKIAEWRSARQPYEVQLGMIRENRDAAVRAQTTRETIAKMRVEVTALEADSEKHTSALDALDAYKAELLANLPIPGLVVTSDGDLERDGVPFHLLNKAQRVRIAVEIAKLRAGDLRVVCVDELENLDSESRDELLRLAEEADLQLFVSRVSDGPLTVTAH